MTPPPFLDFLASEDESISLSALFSSPSFVDWSEKELQQQVTTSQETLQDSQTNHPELIRGALKQEHLNRIFLREWKSVLSWITFQPEEVSQFVDTHGQTALHYCCLFRAPATVIEAILYASPDSATTKNDDNELALHWAVRLPASKEVLNLMMDANPKSPFEFDSKGQTPLALLYDRNETSLNEAFRSGGSKKVMSTFPWKQMMLFVRSFYFDLVSAPKNAKFLPLHAIAACPCNLPVFQFVLNVCAQDVVKYDEFGNLPLHLVASSKLTNGISARDKLEELLRRYPQSAGIRDGRGRMPLHLAVESGKRWEEGVKLLLDAEPQALCMQDCCTKLYPFMLAGAHSGTKTDAANNRNRDVNTIFCLLRENPSIVMPFPFT